MARLVTRIDDDLARAVDDLVAAGEFASRSEAVRIALHQLVDSRRRVAVGHSIVEGYRRIPLTPDELEGASALIRGMIAEEPW